MGGEGLRLFLGLLALGDEVGWEADRRPRRLKKDQRAGIRS